MKTTNDVDIKTYEAKCVEDNENFSTFFNTAEKDVHRIWEIARDVASNWNASVTKIIVCGQFKETESRYEVLEDGKDLIVVDFDAKDN